MCTGSFAQASCGPGAGPCGEANGTPGCEDVPCCAEVCDPVDGDPFCCIVVWDQACADAAIDLGCAEAAGCEPVENPDVEGQGFWRAVCVNPPLHPSGENANLPGYVACVNVTATFAVVSNVTDLCNRLTPDPNNDKCEKAEAQFMALLLNICSGRVAECNCIDDLNLLGATTVGEAVVLIDNLLSNPTRTVADCKLALAIADDINSDVSLVYCPPLPCDVVLDPLSCSDLNGDGVVDCFDLLLLLVTWGPCGDGDCPADCDSDGNVGAADLLFLLAEWTGPLPVEVQDCVDEFFGMGEVLQAFIACVEAFCCL